MKPLHRAPQVRTGFTLVELLVIIAIITVLTGLVAAGVMRYIETQRVNNTRSTLLALQSLLEKHWKQVVDESRKEEPPQNIVLWAEGDLPRAKVLWAKARLMEAFPVSYDEIKNAHKYPLYALSNPIIPANDPRIKRKNIETYKKALGNPPSGGATESAACLLLALSQGRGGLAATGLDGNIADTNGDDIKEIIDNWGNPVTFIRFPTCPELNSANPNSDKDKKSQQFADPLDPEGTLLSPNWSLLAKNSFASIFHPLSTKIGGRDCAYYTIPVIVSSGRYPHKLGVHPQTMAITNFTDTLNNHFSCQIRLGGPSQ